jgi:coenzyme F420-reducing hydrogenase delta subunit
MKEPKIVVFTCNWNAYSGLEAAGVHGMSYPPALHPIKVMCLGRLHPGIILKAFEKGADGVLLLGCPPGECHYEFGNQRAEEMVNEARDMVRLLGYGQERLKLEWVAAGEGQALADQVRSFVTGLSRVGVP